MWMRTFDAILRCLDENSWNRIKIFKKYTKYTKLRMLLRGKNLIGYRHYLKLHNNNNNLEKCYKIIINNREYNVKIKEVL